MIYQQNNCLYSKVSGETLEVRPWGDNSFRVRSTKYPQFTKRANALTMPLNDVSPQIKIDGNAGKITNGGITAQIDVYGNLAFYNDHDDLLLQGYQRTRINQMDPGLDQLKMNHFNSALDLDWHEFKGQPGGDFELRVRFESDRNEKIFGMGQYQQDFLNLKNSKLELALRNSQATVPFFISNKGYGFLWNNPAIGDVTFAKNLTEWHAQATKEMDFWITAADTPHEIEEQYADVTGTVPMMPDFAMGVLAMQTALSNPRRIIGSRARV